MNVAVWYARLNRRERTLGVIVAGAVFLLVNIFIWSGLLGALKNAHAQMASLATERKTQKVYMQERDTWQKRQKWLDQHQPVLKSQGESSTLLEEIRQIAGKDNILIENPAIGSSDSTADHQAVFASIETKSPWPPLVHFLYNVQQPDAFIVFESVNLQVDGSDPTTMRGKFKIARWFAPQNKKG